MALVWINKSMDEHGVRIKWHQLQPPPKAGILVSGNVKHLIEKKLEN